MDILYFFRHSKFDDVEIRYSLRSVEAHLPFVRKVWIFGDRPRFLTGDTAFIEHVPHEAVAWIDGAQVPVTNFFKMFFLTALIPELGPEYLWFCDDFYVLQPLTSEDAKTCRYVEDLGEINNRGRGLWKESLWRTYDLLKRLGYTGYNFETHVPTYFTKKWVLEAYREFRDFTTDDRWFGMLGPTAILNHAYKRQPRKLVRVSKEGARAGFHGKHFPYAEIAAACQGKRFLNFDDDAFNQNMQQYLADRFPHPSKYEQPVDNGTPRPTADARAAPVPVGISTVVMATAESPERADWPCRELP